MRKCGTSSAYTGGCRCDACREANTKRQHAYMQHKAQLAWGQATPKRVDATPSRLHVQYLQQHGMGYREISRVSGVSITAIVRLLGYDTSKPANAVKPETEAKLLAVQVSPQYSNPTVTSRKLQALVALGYPQSYLAERIGTTPSNFTPIIHGLRPITRRHVQAVNDLYAELQGTPGPSDKVRARAVKLRWLPPLAWDDIEDLDERPDRSHLRKGRNTLHSEDLLELIAQGNTPEAIAQRYGIKPESVQRTYYRAIGQVSA